MAFPDIVLIDNGAGTFDIALSSGGTTYNESISESVTATDSTTVTNEAVAAITELVTSADTPASQLSTTQSVDESSSTTDSVNGGVQLTDSVNESVSAVDTSDGLATYPVSVSESGSALDTPDSTKSTSSEIVESGSAADTPASTYSTTAAITESSTSSDTQDGVIVIEVSISESATASDSPGSTLSAIAAITESGSAVDTPASTLSSTSAVSESAAASDTPASVYSTLASVSESSGASDSQDGLVQILAAITESSPATDSVPATADMNVSVSESASADDPVDGQTGNVMFEAGSALDDVTAVLSTAVSVSESSSASDTITGEKLVPVSLSETSPVTDQTSGTASMGVSVVEINSFLELFYSSKQASFGVTKFELYNAATNQYIRDLINNDIISIEDISDLDNVSIRARTDSTEGSILFEDGFDGVTIGNNSRGEPSFLEWQLPLQTQVPWFNFQRIENSGIVQNQFYIQGNEYVVQLNSTGPSTSTRVQWSMDVDQNYNVFHTKYDMWFHPSLAVLNQYPNDNINWINIWELWNENAPNGDETRWNINLKKKTSNVGDPVYFQVRSRIAVGGVWGPLYPYQDSIDPVPFGQWFTMEVYWNKTTDEFKLWINNQLQVSYVGENSHPSYPNLYPTWFTPIKFYLSNDIYNWVTVRGGTLQVKYRNFQLFSQDAISIGSVNFNLSGASSFTRTDNGDPFTLFGDSGSDYLGWGEVAAQNFGVHNLLATPYTGANETGDEGESLGIQFTLEAPASFIDGVSEIVAPIDVYIAIESGFDTLAEINSIIDQFTAQVIQINPGVVEQCETQDSFDSVHTALVSVNEVLIPSDAMNEESQTVVIPNTITNWGKWSIGTDDE